MLTFPNAKINIGLNIIEKRSDGFHNIESVFYPVGWCDVLEMIHLTPSPSPYGEGSFIFESTGLPIPGNQANNLIIKAFNLIIEYRKQNKKKHSTFYTLHSALHKNIPMGAGLGGGSADGAFALKMLNEILELNLSVSELQNLARKLGSDCAFFIENHPVFCHQKGDEFEDFDLDLKGKFIVLVNPDIHISTAEAYSGVIPRKPEISLKEALKQPISDWKKTIKNDFEEKLLIKYPTIARLKESLYQHGAIYASMTGSGSTVYGIFENEIDLKNDFPNFAMWQGYLSDRL
jgi:4-diphosphocytidyl-2-C-methyl-D-erythritol kinase